MRKHLAIVRRHAEMTSAILAIATLAACGTTSGVGVVAQSPRCAGSGTLHAYVVVQHLSGASLQRCVAFKDTLTGKQLMDESGIKYETQSFSFGLGMCSLDGEPATFTECFPQGKPYWMLFVEQAGAWKPAQSSFDSLGLNDKDAFGWRYVAASDQSPSPPPLANES